MANQYVVGTLIALSHSSIHAVTCRCCLSTFLRHKVYGLRISNLVIRDKEKTVKYTVSNTVIF